MNFWTGYFAAKALSGDGGKDGFIIPFEVLFISGAVGITSESWWAFGGTMLAFLVILSIRQLAWIFIVIMSLGWGTLGYELGKSFSHGMGAPIVVGGVFFLVSLGSHASGLEDFDGQ